MEFITKNLLVFFTSSAFIALITFIFYLLKKLNLVLKNLEEIPNIKLAIDDLTIEVKSIDYATAKQYGNGYMQHKAEKRQELIDHYNIRGKIQ